MYVKRETHPEPAGTCRNLPKPAGTHPEPAGTHPEPAGTDNEYFLEQAENNKNKNKIK